ncbi:MAG TPA: MlaD family protein [Desulfomonilia bacterium]|nr:MlaD family protein [Desulfomonilia bacterium]
MIKKPNRTLIGAFVIGAVILATVGIMTFGAGRYFTKQPTFVMFFDGSVKGLNVGAPVVFKGVKVGQVTDISLRLNPDSKSVQILVLAELDPHSITGTKGRIDSQEFFKQLVRRGLKAQLLMQNFLTSQLMVELDFHPEREVKPVKTDIPYPEIPTTPSRLEEFTRTIEKLPLDQLVTKLTSAIEGLERATTSPELMKSIKSLSLALEDVRTLVQNLNSNVTPLASDIKGTLADSRKMIQDFDKHSSSLQASIERAADAAQSALTQADKTFQALERVSSADSPVMYRLNQTLEKISDASDSIRDLSDYINRHPESLLKGKR